MNKRTYFSFAIAPSMFPQQCVVYKHAGTVRDIERATLDGGELISCINPSHKATIDAMETRFGIKIEIPTEPPKVKLEYGDLLVVMSVTGLQRLTDRREYTKDEIDDATFEFHRFIISKM